MVRSSRPWRQVTKNTAKILTHEGVQGVIILDEKPGHKRVKLGSKVSAGKSRDAWSMIILIVCLCSRNELRQNFDIH